MPQYLPPYLPWLLATLVALLLVWLAWRRPNRQRLAWRMLASAITGVSLVLLVFPPTRQQAIRPSSAILLTEGYDADTLKKLLGSTEAKPQVYTYKLRQERANPVPDLSTWKQEQPELQTIHLLGFGLEEHELRSLSGVQVLPHLSPLPPGLTAVHWPEQTKLGETVTISGKYKNQPGPDTWLYLQAAGKQRDSVLLKADTTQTFQLHYTPKQAGRFTYALLAKKGEQVDTLGQVPLQVEPVQQLGVLLLAAAPSFEYKFLKNHLAGLQHRVAFRTQVSKDISQSEWSNMPRQELGRITPKLLQAFDVVVAAPQVLQELTTAEQDALEQAVTEDGLGVLTLAAKPDKSRRVAFFTGFEGRRLSQSNRTVRALWNGRTAMTVVAPYTLVETGTVRGLVEEQGDNLLAAARQEGWGKVGLSMVTETFPWQLEGKEEVYTSYWANLLSAVARPKVQEKFWQVGEPLVPQVGRPVQLLYTDHTFEGTSTTPTVAVSSLIDSLQTHLPLTQSTLQPEQSSAAFWPHRRGWHVIQKPEGLPYYFYVQDTSDWIFENRQARQRAVQAYVAKQGVSTIDRATAYKEEPLPLLWFFALFVLSSGFLWLEEKF